MPILQSTYKPSLFFKSRHFNTIFRTLFVPEIKNSYKRERISTPDGDFMDLDFSVVGSSTIAILLHGLEGSAQSKYIVSTVNYLNLKKIDAVAVNFRGCSGQPNKLLSTYHSGKTDDLETVVQHILQKFDYQNIVLIGFSLGGNVTLKYIGDLGNAIHPKIKCGVAFSSPIDLAGSASEINKKENFIYLKEFLKTLKEKTLEKKKRFPDAPFSIKEIENAKDFNDFDNLYTAPVHGFKSAQDYWDTCSSKPVLNTISIPTLLVNALDDSFLSASCFPNKIAQKSHFLYLETPKYGGHLGFIQEFSRNESSWLEQRAFRFIAKHID